MVGSREGETMRGVVEGLPARLGLARLVEGVDWMLERAVDCFFNGALAAIL